MCRSCRILCRNIRYEFHEKLYHDFHNLTSTCKPDFVIFFNPSLYRPSLCGFDTWSRTIQCALNHYVPVLVTSLSEEESSRNLLKIELTAESPMENIQTSKINPYSSLKPQRNFSADIIDPIIFRNQYYFIVRKYQELV